MTYDIQERKKCLKKAEQEYRSLNRQTALTQRNHFNEELAAANAIAMKADKVSILKRIIYDEQVREQSKLSRRYFPKRNQPGRKVDRVQNYEGSKWHEASSPRDVAKACQRDTELKYKETESTPLMQRDMHELFGNFAETQFSRNFRENKCDLPDSIPQWTRDMLEKVKIDNNIPRLPVPMSPKEVQQVWMTVKEHKAASPSGRYNGVYKALSMNPQLLQILTISMNLPFLTGHPYRRWHTMVDIMAFKKKDNIKVSNIRSIIISEADWNAAGKIQITRRMMKQAESHDLLPLEHMGGRKGRKSTDGVLTKRLIMDNARISAKSMVIISTDAANCYDRMMHKYISFVCIKWGLTVQVMIALLQPLQKATHHTRTAYGDSHKGFQGVNLQGAGQGNTGAAPYWTAISTPIIELMNQNNLHAEFISPISGAIVILTLLAFVDDTELFLTKKNEYESNEELIARAETSINMWREFLYVTGGVMRASKCSWTLMAYEGSWAKKKLQKQNKNLGDIHMPDETGAISKVPRYDIDDPRQYLGVIQTTSGSEDTQEESMNSKIEEWNKRIQQSRLPPALNLNALMTKIHRSLIYPLPALTMTEDCLQKMSDKLYWELLPKCGIVRTFPIRYRHLPTRYQGLGLPTLYLEQEIMKLMEIVAFSNTETVVWKQLKLGLEIIQLHIGLPGLILNYEYDRYSFLCPPCWIKTVWKFMDSQKLHMKGWNSRPHQRENDTFLIQAILSHQISQKEVLVLNECRIYLQIEKLSDIANGDGLRISECFYYGRRDKHKKSTLTWPNLKRPNVTKWLIWGKNGLNIYFVDKNLNSFFAILSANG